MKPVVVLVQDHSQARVRELLESEGFTASCHPGFHDACSDFEVPPSALIVLVSSGVNTNRDLQFLQRLHSRHAANPILFIVCHSSENLAIEAFRAGATDYFRSSEQTEILRAVHQNDSLNREMTPHLTPIEIIGETQAIHELRVLTRGVAPAQTNVLITGETGTGKELVAQMVHSLSPRCFREMISLNCAAIPDSLLESELFGCERGAFTGATSAIKGKMVQADKGTLFFDEIGDMNISAQAKILRVIDTRQVQPIGSRTPLRVDVRIVAATNQDLEDLIAKGLFRADLYYRLNVVRIHIPPLRERKADILLLLAHFAAEFQRSPKPIRFTEDSIQILMDYAWPGNVRELRNVVETTLLTGPDVIEPCHLPSALRLWANDRQPSELSRLIGALSEARWNRSKAAEKLKWSRVTLYRKMRKYDLQNPFYSPVESSAVGARNKDMRQL